MRRKTVAITASAAVVAGLAVWGVAALADDEPQYQWDGGPEVSASPVPSPGEGGQGTQYQWDGGPEVPASPSPEPTHAHDDSHSHDGADAAAPHDAIATGSVDGWNVTVTEVQLNADKTLAAIASNVSPQHQYVLITVNGTNASHDPLDLTLSARLQGSDQKVYDESANVAVPYDTSNPLVTTEPGGTSTVQFVFDVPPAALGKGAALLLGYDGKPFVIVP